MGTTQARGSPPTPGHDVVGEAAKAHPLRATWRARLLAPLWDPLSVGPGPTHWFCASCPILWRCGLSCLRISATSAHRQSGKWVGACASHSQRRGKGWGAQKLPAAQSAEEHLWKQCVWGFLGFADTAWGLHFCVPALGAPWRRIWAALACTDADSAGRPKIGGKGRGEAPLSAGKKMSYPVRRGCSEGGGRLLQHTQQEAQDLSDFSIWRQNWGHCELNSKDN